MAIFMPEQDGMTTLHKLREHNVLVDVITVKAANDLKTVQGILHLGVFDCIMKPFSFERVQMTLWNYARYKRRMQKEQDLTQAELDQFLHYHDERSNKEPVITS